MIAPNRVVCRYNGTIIPFVVGGIVVAVASKINGKSIIAGATAIIGDAIATGTVIVTSATSGLLSIFNQGQQSNVDNSTSLIDISELPNLPTVCSRVNISEPINTSSGLNVPEPPNNSGLNVSELPNVGSRSSNLPNTINALDIAIQDNRLIPIINGFIRGDFSSICKEVRILREYELGFTQAQMAVRLGMQEPSYGKLERGDTRSLYKQLPKILKIFDEQLTIQKQQAIQKQQGGLP